MEAFEIVARTLAKSEDHRNIPTYSCVYCDSVLFQNTPRYQHCKGFETPHRCFKFKPLKLMLQIS